jgi:FKBP-type peptidyl-prolyl cis-trans isomerase FkpA
MNTAIRTGVFVAAAGLLVWAGIAYNHKSEQKAAVSAEAARQEAQKQQEQQAQDIQKIMDQLKKDDVKVGTGAEAKAGDTITVHYVGTFTNGTKFDSSRDRGTPFTFELGAGSVIQGWDLGLVGMKVGGIRKLSIPPELGYGPSDYQTIPGGSTLLFEVELLSVSSTPAVSQ